jgi:two-component system phosphate regulon sensor histidine kinase PhoR
VEAARVAAVRLTVVDAAGRVIADTEHDPATMENHASRPEIAEAIAGRVGTIMRDSSTVKVRTLYVAVPIREQGRVVGVVRAAVEAPVLDQISDALRHKVWLVALLVLPVVAAISYVSAQRVSQPVEVLKRVAERYGSGDFKVRAPTCRWVELSELALALNAMADRLKDRIETVTRHRNELEVVLSGMMEGVVAVDVQGNLARWNQAAARLFDLDKSYDHGRHLYEVIHNPDIQALMARVMEKGDVVQGEVDFGVEAPRGRWLRVRGAPLTDAAGRGIGAVLVAEDCTQQRRLDGMRRDFVANASHELKTPIAAIKGAIETLQDWALEDPAQARRFTEMAARQVDRLENLAGDLLKLSSVEHGVEAHSIVMAPTDLAGVVNAAVETCRMVAEDRQIMVSVACPEHLMVSANAPLLEQALENLLDNAIKYSEPGRRVWVEGVATAQGAEVAVRDEGCGIAPQHLDRIFERFYRVDKARSREAGGTGLGLSIVRHIALAHGGSVRVNSVPGEGSVFTLQLPPVVA